MIKSVQTRVVDFVTRANWIIFTVCSLLGFLFLSFEFAVGVLSGGLVATVNFHLLSRTLNRTFGKKRITSHRGVLLKYYIRFTISGFIIFLLLFFRFADPVGLLIGLSVVVVSLMIAAMLELTKKKIF